MKELTLSMQFNYLFHVDFHVKKLDLWSFISIFFVLLISYLLPVKFYDDGIIHNSKWVAFLPVVF